MSTQKLDLQQRRSLHQVDVLPVNHTCKLEKALHRCGFCRYEGKTIEFERAGPRKRLYFCPAETKAAIVTCGGLCPGINDVVRSVFLKMHSATAVVKFSDSDLDTLASIHQWV